MGGGDDQVFLPTGAAADVIHRLCVDPLDVPFNTL